MSILFVTSTFPFGTGEEFFGPEVDSVAHLYQNRIFVFPLRQGRSIRSLPDGVELIRYKRWMWNPLNSLKEFIKQFFGANCAFGSRSLYQAIFTNIVKESFVAGYSNQLRRIIETNKIQHVHAYWCTSAATLARVGSSDSPATWSFTAHSGDLNVVSNLSEKIAGAKFVRFISLTKMSQTQCVYNLGNKGYFIPIGVSPYSRQVGMRLTDDNSTLRIASIGSLIKIKGHALLLNVVKMAIDAGILVRLDIFGHGALEQSLRSMVKVLNLENCVFFRGAVSHQQLLKELGNDNFDLVINSSITADDGQQEGIPVSLLESMIRELNVMGPISGGIPEIVPRDYLYQEGSSEELLQLLLRFHRLSREARKMQAIANRVFVEEYFNVHKNMLKFLQLIDED